jgi:hypothetical protein
MEENAEASHFLDALSLILTNHGGDPKFQVLWCFLYVAREGLEHGACEQSISPEPVGRG